MARDGRDWICGDGDHRKEGDKRTGERGKEERERKRAEKHGHLALFSSFSFPFFLFCFCCVLCFVLFRGFTGLSVKKKEHVDSNQDSPYNPLLTVFPRH